MPRFNLDEYMPVEERLKKFWADHPNGAIRTEMLAATPDHKSVIVRAGIFFERLDEQPVGSGIAQETAGGTGANSTSHVENCETSAIGRALANCGYSGDKRPSREEMAKANRGQERPAYAPRQEYAPRPQVGRPQISVRPLADDELNAVLAEG